MFRRIRWAACAVVAALLAVPDQAVAGELDQQQPSFDGAFQGVAGPPFSFGLVWAQTFTAGRTGLLDQVDLLLFRSADAVEPLIVEIRDVTQVGVPGSTVRASASVAPADVPLYPAPQFVALSFESPAPVLAGGEYAIVAYSAGEHGYGWMLKFGSAPSPYEGGATFRTTDLPPTSLTTWFFGGALDFAFKTYVAYPFEGFFSPLDDAQVNRAKAGSSIPIKFGLGGDEGLQVIEDGYPQLVFTECTTGDEVDPPVSTTTANNGLTFDSATDTYTYVWKTNKSWKGKCGTFTLRLDDGTEHTAEFQFK